MSILYILLTVLMFLDCVLLVFLVLLQLPKKEAGMGGTAFGGAATDALFGAGSGNVLTKITKYVAGIFFGLAILMALLAAHKPESDASMLAKKLIQRNAAPMAAPTTSDSAPATTTPGSGLLQLSNLPPAVVASTNVGAAPVAPKQPTNMVNTNK